MKALSMAILSPGRPQYFPPPSRGRSRSSRSAPILYRGGEAESGGDQEPCSPKVTCIGQVRARKSRRRRRRRRRWSFLAGGRRVLRRWVVFLRSGYCKRVDAEGSGRFGNVLEVVGIAAESGILGEEGSGNPRNLDGVSVRDSEGIAVMVTGCGGDSPCRALSLGEIFLREDVGGGSGGGIGNIPGNLRNRSGSVRDSEEIVVESLMLTWCKSEPAGIRERCDLE